MGEPIRILQMIGSLNVGGSQAMIINLYKNIDRTKVQFDFILDHPKETYFKDTVMELGAKVYEMPTFTGKNYFQVRKAWKDFFVSHPEYRVLHSHVRSYASIYIPIAKKYGVKTIIHSHSTSNGSGFSSLIKKILQYPLRYQADYFMGCSKEAGEWLFGKKIANSDKYNIIKNAIHANDYRYNSKYEDEYRKKLGLINSSVYIHIGRFHKSKNHEFLLDVFKKIKEVQTNAILLLVGDGELRDEIVNKISLLNLEDSVLILGNRNDVPKILQVADVCLFPSLWEGLGIVAIEAQAAGVPCICSFGVPEEVAITNECYFLPLDEIMWVNKAVLLKKDRRDTYLEVVKAGYDICMSSKWMERFYLDKILVDKM